MPRRRRTGTDRSARRSGRRSVRRRRRCAGASGSPYRRGRCRPRTGWRSCTGGSRRCRRRCRRCRRSTRRSTGQRLSVVVSGTFEQTPSVVAPGNAHDLQVPWQALAQQTPCSQKPVAHSLAAPQVTPLPLSTQAVPLQVAGDTQSVEAGRGRATGLADTVGRVARERARAGAGGRRLAGAGAVADARRGEGRAAAGAGRAQAWPPRNCGRRRCRRRTRHACRSRARRPDTDRAGPAPAGTLVHLPALPGSAHDLHVPEQGASQQTPSSHRFEPHSLGQACTPRRAASCRSCPSLVSRRWACRRFRSCSRRCRWRDCRCRGRRRRCRTGRDRRAGSCRSRRCPMPSQRAASVWSASRAGRVLAESSQSTAGGICRCHRSCRRCRRCWGRRPGTGRRAPDRAAAASSGPLSRPGCTPCRCRVQTLSQQTPCWQEPEPHSLLSVQVAPRTFLPQTLPLQTLPGEQSALVLQLTRQMPACRTCIRCRRSRPPRCRSPAPSQCAAAGADRAADGAGRSPGRPSPSSRSRSRRCHRRARQCRTMAAQLALHWPRGSVPAGTGVHEALALRNRARHAGARAGGLAADPLLAEVRIAVVVGWCTRHRAASCRSCRRVADIAAVAIRVGGARAQAGVAGLAVAYIGIAGQARGRFAQPRLAARGQRQRRAGAGGLPAGGAGRIAAARAGTVAGAVVAARCEAVVGAIVTRVGADVGGHAGADAALRRAGPAGLVARGLDSRRRRCRSRCRTGCRRCTACRSSPCRGRVRGVPESLAVTGTSVLASAPLRLPPAAGRRCRRCRCRRRRRSGRWDVSC